MKVQVQSVHFDADAKLIDFIQKKLDKLDTFYDRIVDGEVIMRVEKDEAKDNKVIEIKLNIPGAQLFAKKQAKSGVERKDETQNTIPLDTVITLDHLTNPDKK